MNRRQFIGVTAASAAALAAGCDPCDCNDTLCQDLKPYEFGWTRNTYSRSPNRDIITVTDKVLNRAQTGYITSTWQHIAEHDEDFHMSREDWLSLEELWSHYVVCGQDMELRTVNGFCFSLQELDFEPC